MHPLAHIHTSVCSYLSIYLSIYLSKPRLLGLQNTPTASLQMGKTSPTSVLFMTQN